MNRGTSTGQFILAAIWLALALFWYFVNNNVFVSLVWLTCAAVILILGLVKRKKEKAEEKENN